MSHYNTIMNQLLHFIPRHRFETIVKQHDGERYVKRFSSWNQFTTLLYTQAAGKQSLREIQQALEINQARRYHWGLPAIKRSTLADANQRRSWQIFEQLFYRILTRCKDVTPKHRFRFKNPLHTIDATVIDLCLIERFRFLPITLNSLQTLLRRFIRPGGKLKPSSNGLSRISKSKRS